MYKIYFIILWGYFSQERFSWISFNGIKFDECLIWNAVASNDHVIESILEP